MVDPNIYALSIELSLDAGQAFDTLDSFEDAVVGLEEQVTTAAQNAIGKVDETISQVEANLGNLTSAIRGINLEGDKLAAALAGAGVEASDMTGDLDSQIAQVKKSMQFWEEIRDLNEEIVDFGQEELERVEDYIKVIDQILKTVELKNKAHLEELDLVEQEQDLVSTFANTWNDVGDSINNANVRQVSFYSVLRNIFDLLLEFDKETENFVHANYRAYGSMQAITNETRVLSTEYGILRAESIAAMKALADVKTPIESIDKLTGEIGRLNRITGVTIDTWANYSRGLRFAGLDAEATTHHMNLMAAAQRKLGLASSDLQRIINDQNMSMEQQILMFGEDAPEAFMKMQLGLSGIAKELGMSEKAAQDWMKTLQFTGAEAIRFWTTFGEVAADAPVEERYAAMEKAARNFAKTAGISFEALANGEKLGEEQQIMLNTLAQRFGITGEQIMLMARASRNLTNEQKAMLMTVDGLDQAFAKEMGRNKQWQESIDNLTRQWETLKSSIMGILGVFAQLAADALVPLLRLLNGLIHYIGVVVNAFRDLWVWMENTIPGFSILSSAIKFAVGWALILVGVFATLGGLTGLLGNFFSFVTNGIVGLGQAIGDGIAAMARAVQGVMIPLLALGAAFLMVGAGAYLFAQSVKTVAELGWAAIPALLGMIATVGVLGLVLIGLASLVQGPIAVGLLVLSAAFLAVGASAVMVGHGLMLAAQAFQILSSAVIELAASGAIVDFSKQMLSASWRVLLAAPLLLAAALILAPAAIAFGIAGTLLAAAMSIFSFAIYMLGAAGEKFASGMEALMAGVGFMTMIDWGTLVLGAGSLLAAGILLSLAAPFFAPAALLIGLAGSLFASGMQGLQDGAAAMANIDWGTFIAGAMNMVVAGFILTLAATAFVPAAMLIGVAGIILGTGLTMLASGAAKAADIDFTAMAANLLYGSGLLLWVGPVMLGAAMLLMPAGVALGVAGLMLWVGSIGINKSADLLVGVGEKLYEAGVSISGAIAPLTAGMLGLVPIGLASLLAGPSLLLGALALLPGAATIKLAGWLLESGANNLYDGSLTLSYAVKHLANSADELHVAGTYLLYASGAMMTGAATLSWGAVLLVGATAMLFIAGATMLPAAMSLYFGMFWLEGALRKLSNIAPGIADVGDSMWKLAMSFVILSSTNFNVLGDVADAGLRAIPKINAFSRDLSRSAITLNNAVNKFEGPASKLTQILNSMQDATQGLDLHGLALETDVAEMGAELEKYATALEAAATRVEAAVVAKALPAIDEANASGIAEVARSEAITTVQVMDQREGNQTDENKLLAVQQVTLLAQLVELLTEFSGDGRSEITDIHELLQEHLPHLTNNERGLLASEVNQWMK